MSQIDAKIQRVKLELEDEYRAGNTQHDKMAQVQISAKLGTSSDSIVIILTRETTEQLGGIEKLKAGDYITINIDKASVQEEP
jgi:hypothetical protein